MKNQSAFFNAFASRPRPAAANILVPAANDEGGKLRTVLAGTTSAELSLSAIRDEVAGRLGMLTPEAFRYFLPAFMSAGISEYASLDTFVAELVTALTEPMLNDVHQALDRVARIPPEMGLSLDVFELLKQQQMEWYEGGGPQALFASRTEGLSPSEGAAILAFLVAIRDAHGEDFPLGDPQVAIDRYWARFLKG
jgi:hypothetical protein